MSVGPEGGNASAPSLEQPHVSEEAGAQEWRGTYTQKGGLRVGHRRCRSLEWELGMCASKKGSAYILVTKLRGPH